MQRSSASPLRPPAVRRGAVPLPLPLPLRSRGLRLDHPSPSVSPLVAGVQPVNLRFPREGGLGVALGDRWPAMLGDLWFLGRILVVTGNPAAGLGHYREYPDLASCQGHGDRFAHGDGMAVDLDHWNRARVVETRHGAGLRYAVEFANAHGETIHKVCLTSDSRFGEFLEWTRAHQAAGIPPMPAPRKRDLFRRRPAGRRKALLSLLNQLLGREVPIRVAVGNPGASQSHPFVFREMRESGEWVYVAGEDAAWHFSPGQVHQLRRETCACCGGYWVRALDTEGTTLFLLSPAPETDLILWNGLAAQAVGADV